MKQIFTFLAVILLTANTYAQVVIGTTTPDASSVLDSHLYRKRSITTSYDGYPA